MTNFSCSRFYAPALVWAFFLSAHFFSNVYADQLIQSDVEISTINPSAVNVESMGFDGWGLNEEETERYRKIMEGPRGNWSPKLDPLHVLGINAETEQERRHYAKRQAVIEHDRLVRERAFELVYLREYARLYPKESLYVTPPPIAQKRQGNGRKTLKVTLPCDNGSACFARIAPTLANATSRPVDLYFFGMKSVDDIQAWAKQIGIDPEWVRAKSITLNLGEELPE